MASCDEDILPALTGPRSGPESGPESGANRAPGHWLRRFADTTRARGFFLPLGRSHFAGHLPGDGTLLVSFETLPGPGEDGWPLGWQMAGQVGWSNLCLGAGVSSWFRAPEIAELFNTLEDEGFFDRFERVVFYGAGAAAYAACAYSAASPAAQVLAIEPQATQRPDIAGWDHRFPAARRLDFSHGYGYAPDMLQAAERAFLVYDPTVAEEAMHAALFRGPQVTKLHMPHMSGGALPGSDLANALQDMGLLHPMLRAIAEGSLTARGFARAYRRRRNYRPYLAALAARLRARGQENRLRILLAHADARLAPRAAATKGPEEPQLAQ